MNYIIQEDNVKNDFARYLYGSAFLPVTSTFQQSVKNGNFITWPGAGDIHFKNNIGITVPTMQGFFRSRTKEHSVNQNHSIC